jgi:hypothetical protein
VLRCISSCDVFFVCVSLKYDACHILFYRLKLALKLKRIFVAITTITILLILTGFAYNSVPPARSATPSDSDWQLTVTGIVKNPLTLNWTEITALPKTIVPAALICVDFPNKILLQGYWGGVKLNTLIELAESSPSVIKVAFYAADGYSTDLTIETAKRNDVILAYELNSTSLNDLRLVVPGKWGYKWISQITNIELVDYNYLGRWESQGYPDDADISAGGGQSVKDLRLLPKVNNTSPAPTPTPTPPLTTPSPSPSPEAPSGQTTPTPEPLERMSIPTEAIYAIALSAVAVLLVAVLTFVRKKK